ncbi:MAG: MASE3 domain-containing protein [Thermoplasmata archaeon]
MKEKLRSAFEEMAAYYWFLGLFVVVGLYLTSLYDYLLFHSLVELFSIIVAALIFTITWNTRKRIENNYLLFVGTAFLFIGGIDLVHTLAYEGMGVFTDWGPNLPTQLWISARYVEALTLFIAPLLLFRDKIKVSYAMIGYGSVFILIMISIFGGVFPTCYVEGVGLTPFKKISEYTISIILGFSLYFLYRYRAKFKKYVFQHLAISIILTIGSEIAFTFYVSVYGFSNLVGHFLKLISFFLIYQALIVTGFREPFDLLYKEVKEREDELEKSKQKVELERDRLQTYLDLAGSIIVALDRGGKVTLINRRGCEILGRSKEDIVGKNWFENFVPEEDREGLKQLHEKLMSGKVEVRKRFENPVIAKDGEERIISWYNTILKNGEGNIIRSLSSGIDITHRKKAEEREEFLHSLLRHDVGNKNQIVKGYLELMKGYDLPDEVKDFLKKSIHTVDESSEIIERVRTLREIEKEEEIYEVNLNSVLDKVLSEHQDQLDERGIKSNIIDCGCIVKGGSLLKTLFSNLINNAVQHSDCEKIRIKAECKGDGCIVTVEDDGEGIPDELKGKVFEKGFKRGKKAGTGLGLYMVKEIVESYGGNVSVKDSELGGARFDVKLKRADDT